MISCSPNGHILACICSKLLPPLLLALLLSAAAFDRFPPLSLLPPLPPLPPWFDWAESCSSYASPSWARSLSGRAPYLTHWIASYSDLLANLSKHLLRKLTEHRWLSSAISLHSRSSIPNNSLVYSCFLKQSGRISTKFIYVPSTHICAIWSSRLA